jgi:hypothetical protein
VHPELDPTHFRDRTLRTLPADPRTVSLERGRTDRLRRLWRGRAGGMALVKQLAEQLGAALGGTRVAADRGWLAVDRFIGSTGQIVAPKLYMAFGVSGAGQHLSGITASELVIAVNSDRTAPILKRADLGVVGDLHQILPILIRKLQALARDDSRPNSGNHPMSATSAIEPFDVIVVGAGPAGSAAALLSARAGLKVLLLERGEYPGAKNVSGAVFYGSAILNELIPNWWEQAPVERYMCRRDIALCRRPRR